MKFWNFLWLCFVFVVLLLFFVSVGVVNTFGNIELSSIVFHFFMPLKNMSYDWLENLITFIALAFFVFLFFLSCFLKFPKRRTSLSLIVLSIFLSDIYYIDQHFSLKEYIRNQYNESNFIEKNYVNPRNIKITFPEEKRNLIFIQVESLESSVQDKNNGGLLEHNLIPELTAIARLNINFAPSNLVGGAIVLPETGWTMGGLIAETAGIPLKSWKTHTKQHQIGNEYDKHKSFLTNIISLGDILKDAGYNNYFLLGSGKEFAAQDVYVQEHGSHFIWDKNTIKKEMNVKEPASTWPLLDQDVYKFAETKLNKIAASGKPFSIVIQTFDSHIDGFLSPNCPSKWGETLKDVYSCVSLQLSAFIHWCMNQEFFKNTTIVIVGDHCSMSNILFQSQINSETGYYTGTERQVYNVFINSPIDPSKEKNRLFSTMDMFPTILASLGVTIEGDRLALGTNLFSKEKTLLEKYGYDFVYQELKKKSNFYNRELLYPK